MKKFIPILFYSCLSGCITVTNTENTTPEVNNENVEQNESPDMNENSAPIISGTPTRKIEVGSYYSFLPVASDENGDSLSFSITNKPSWASFNTQTGELFGTTNSPTDHVNINISVSDGSYISKLDTFAIEVTLQQKFNVQISWEKPLLNTNGSSLNNISSYRIMYGSSAENKDNTVYFDGSAVVGTIEDLSPGDYFLSMTTITQNALESDESDTFYFNVSN